MKYTPEKITKLEENQIFVFGSNEGGIHGRGAAKDAYHKFGAIWGHGDGRQGQCYGISTKDKKIQTLPLDKISIKINKFMRYAEVNQDLIFLVTPIGTGLACYKASDIAPLFFANEIPDNVILPETFWKHKS